MADDGTTPSSSLETVDAPLQAEPDVVNLGTEDTADGTGISPPVRPSRVLDQGEVIGRFVVIGKLGAGGMGVVYAAYDPELDRKVALKFLLPHGSNRETARARLQMEARAMAQLSHPNVINVHDVGTRGDQVYLAMEFVEGLTLDAWLEARRRTWSEVVDVFVQVGRGLAAAHAGGLLHRDIKPENMMVTDRGRGLVMDFGLARTVEQSDSEGVTDEAARSNRSTSGQHSVRITRGGALLGTPAYMAPEQFAGEETDARTDQFGFCVALWEALYGERPFGGTTLVELCLAVTEGDRRPVPPGRSVPGWLRRAVERGLNPAPEQRWPSMDALLTALSSEPRRRRNLALGVVGLLVVGGLGLTAYQRADSEVCTGASESLATVWDAQRRQQIETAVLGTGVGFASDVWERIGPGLDTWAAAWVTMHTDACEATQRRHEQSEAVMDLRMACLHRARLDLDAAADVLSEATPKVVRKAHNVVDGLPQLERCADIEALQAKIAPPDADEVDAVEAVHADLAEARAQERGGKYERATAAIRNAELKLEGLRYAPVRTHVRLALGLVQLVTADYPAAEQSFRDVQRLGAPLRQYAQVRHATTMLIFVIGHAQGRHAEALALRDIAEGLASGDDQAEAATHTNIGAVLHGLGRFEEAEAEHRAAVAILRAALGPEHAKVARAEANVGGALVFQGKLDEAEAVNRSVLAKFQVALGPNHPVTAQTQGNLASILIELGKLDEAEAMLRAATAILRTALGGDHPLVAQSLESLGRILTKRGKHAQAEAEFRAALALRVRTVGADNPAIAASHSALGDALSAGGKHTAAEAEFRAALAVLSGKDDPRKVARTREQLAASLASQSKHAAAAAEYRHILELRRGLGDDGVGIAECRLDLGAALLASGDRTAATPELVSAWEALSKPGVAPALRARAAGTLARAQWPDSTRREQANALVSEALALYADNDAEGTPLPPELEAWLLAHAEP